MLSGTNKKHRMGKFSTSEHCEQLVGGAVEILVDILDKNIRKSL